MVDGKGFVAKRRDEPTPTEDVQEFNFLDREVTGSEMALVRRGGREGGIVVPYFVACI